MSEIAPVRIRLSRAKGFNLQAASLAINGLPAVNCARPGRWGNPFDFRSSEYCWAALAYGCRGDRLGRQEASVRIFSAWIDPPDGLHTVSWEEQPKMGGSNKWAPLGSPIKAGSAPSRDDIREHLRGKNLACWCGLGEPCHGDPLLELANPPICEAV